VTLAVAIDHIQIAIPAGGEADGRRYFTDLLGLVEIPKPPSLATRGGCWFAIGGLQIHLGVDPEFRPAKKAHIALKVENLDKLRQRLEAAGFPVKDDPAQPSSFFSEDPFGNRMEFIAK
jgi:catechol 2,3-dioxygenase-like lactoylglutathione lyase family enzyme